jgi:hypothetical protein
MCQRKCEGGYGTTPKADMYREGLFVSLRQTSPRPVDNPCYWCGVLEGCTLSAKLAGEEQADLRLLERHADHNLVMRLLTERLTTLQFINSGRRWVRPAPTESYQTNTRLLEESA